MNRDSFLYECAASLVSIYGESISDINIIMPSRRGASFFKLELASLISDRPIWQPKFSSIGALMSTITTLREADRIKLITILYRVYSKYHTESFDKFYYWGGVILSDFDTIDNYMVDAKILYSNIDDIKEIESRFDYLEPEQREIILRFWGSFRGDKEHSPSQKEFLRIWNTLYNIYTDFKAELLKERIGYGGMIYRMAAETIMKDRNIEYFDDEKFAVIGFNALSVSESRLFDYIKAKHESHFFWDYDNYYINDTAQEAGLFIKKNIDRYGDSCSGYSRDNFIKPKNIEIIDTPSEVLSCRYSGKIVSDLLAKQGYLSRESAVVLTNESLLIPLLYSLPAEIEHLNITSGYPLKSSASYLLVDSIVKLHLSSELKDGRRLLYHRELSRILSNRYIVTHLDPQIVSTITKKIESSREQMRTYIDAESVVEDQFTELLFSYPEGIMAICDKFESIFKQIANGGESKFSIDEMEYINKTLESIISLRNSLEGDEHIITTRIFYSLLDKYLSSASVTFEGEPLLGMQVMGILESRNIDFKNVVILSLSEDNYPSVKSLNSLIPPNLRRGYSLPTIYNHEAMYSYYFYRLLQRAENITLLYSSYAGDSLSGEPSRYLHQLRLESPHRDNIVCRSLSLNVVSKERQSIVIHKDESVVAELDKFLRAERTLSASSIYNYIECPLRFYFATIQRIKPQETIEEGITAAQSGLILHTTLESIYEDLIDRKVVDFKKELRALLQSADELDKYIDYAIDKELHSSLLDYSGEILTKKSEIRLLVRSIISYDVDRSDNFRTVKNEEFIVASIKFDQDKAIKVTGRIDRTDILDDGSIRIIDYKSGKSNHKCSALEQVMLQDGDNLSKPIFQTLFYGYVYRLNSGKLVRPSLYHARDISKDGYQETITIGDQNVTNYTLVADQYEELLAQQLNDIFNRDISFSQSTNQKVCQYCPYKEICWGAK